MLAGQDNHPRSALLQQIRVKSDLLENQLADFKNLVRDQKIDSDCQRWERTSDFITKVDNDAIPTDFNREVKTQSALEYTFQLQKTHPTVSVFWIHASSAARFRQAFASIAQKYNIPGYAEPKVNMPLLVKGWLEEKDHGEWLMVIDNADDMQLFSGQPAGTATSPSKAEDEKNLARYLPECAHGTILITTRNKQVGVRMTKGQQPIEVLRMNEEESAQLLRAKLKDISTTITELSTLSSQLEHLPLALAQAAAFIQETSITVHKYLQLLSNSDIDIQIEQQNILASELLSFMSLLDRQDIPARFISHYAERARNGVLRGEIELTEALGILKAFSFITETSGSFDTHRLVQLVT
ncbi:hypothetical protein ACHAO4_010369, partial [Trichoderma viride]